VVHVLAIVSKAVFDKAHLDLGACDLRTAGLAPLTAALPTAPALRHLVLSENKVNDETAAALITAAAANPRLERLELDETRAGKQAIAALLRARQARPTFAATLSLPE
jgi:hypothetical protein